MTSWREALEEWNRSKKILNDRLTLEMRKRTRLYYCFVTGSGLTCDGNILKKFIPRLLNGEQILYNNKFIEIAYGFGKYLGSNIFKDTHINIIQRQYHIYDTHFFIDTTKIHKRHQYSPCSLHSAHEGWFKLGEWTHNNEHKFGEKVTFT